ncbi:MAG: hypothetical protein LBC99_05900 [Spirochaetota bacterium]|jgi:hypothetical protein|nr:hypothetical protein [Spirochaetota bacterium]
MTTAALRKKLHEYIDSMPERRLAALKPLLSHLADDEEPLYTIEQASPEETAKAREIFKEYKKDPDSFVTYVPAKKRTRK